MKKYILLASLFLLTSLLVISCGGSDEETPYVPIAPTSPVVMDLSQVPYPKLSDYKFFQGAMKNQIPAYKVIPYRPNSELFSDYAHKKRFVWMPAGKKATYAGDDNVLDFPIGSVLIKTFYYDNVQPSNTTKIIETRLLIRKDDGWKLYDYIWNEEQTEALLDTDGNGFFVPITWKENNVTKSTTYKIPSATECTTCHKINPNETGEIVIPIGPKPQNLNYKYNYGTSQQNQLTKWLNEGYINTSMPNVSNIHAIVDWRDTSKSLELRARSYIDVNCAHCHRTGGHCDYVPQRFNFGNTDMNLFGICREPLFQITDYPYIITAGHADQSELVFRMDTNAGADMMPIIGRTVIHDEGVQLIKDWINSLPPTCP